VRPDPGGVFDDSKLTAFGYVSPSDKLSDWIADRLVGDHQALAHGGSTIPPWCRHRVGTV
jgi:hypothetical protein